MNAAVRLFSQAGYEAAAVNGICAMAGVSKGAFYHHFPSKQQLFLAILDDWLGDVDSQLFAHLKPGERATDSLMEMGKNLGVIFEAASGQLPMFLEFMVRASRDQAAWDATIAPYRRFQGQFAQLIEKGQQEGSIRPEVDAQAVSWMLISLAVGVLLQGVIDPGMADWNSVTRSAVKMIVESIQRR